MDVTNPLSWIEIEDGHEVTQPAECECGRRYTQYRIAFRFVEALAEGRGERAAAHFMSQIPGGWVPVFCPSCERKDLARQASTVSYALPIPPREAA